MQSNGLATIMLLIPVLAVPALAIFGIPQFAPVVASPLDEGQEKGKESRLGNSSRQPRDDLFQDVEDLSPEPSIQDDLSSHRRDSMGGSNSDRHVGLRRSEKTARSGWSDDVDEESEWGTKQARRSSRPLIDETQDPRRSTGGRIPKKTTSSERFSADTRRELEDGKSNSAIRVASALDENQRVVAADFADDVEQEKPYDAIRGNRSRHVGQASSAPAYLEESQAGSLRNENRTRAKDPRASKRRESTNEPLTWQGAVERLNALDIRSFRLEPGHQLGQFVFICSYTPPDNPRVSYRFEAGADEPLKAVEKVLEQIIEWQQNR